LKTQSLQSRYLAHVKTIAQDWLNWEKAVNPMIQSLKELIEKEVQRGTKRESSFEDFLTGLGDQEVRRGGSLVSNTSSKLVENSCSKIPSSTDLRPPFNQ
jgi:hypothetical protein